MIHGLLAAGEATMRAADKSQSLTQLDEIHRAVVTQMPPGGLGMLFVLVGLTLIGTIYAIWGQRRLAKNQVRLAAMLEEHARRHG